MALVRVGVQKYSVTPDFKRVLKRLTALEFDKRRRNGERELPAVTMAQFCALFPNIDVAAPTGHGVMPLSFVWQFNQSYRPSEAERAEGAIRNIKYLNETPRPRLLASTEASERLSLGPEFMDRVLADRVAARAQMDQMDDGIGWEIPAFDEAKAQFVPANKSGSACRACGCDPSSHRSALRIYDMSGRLCVNCATSGYNKIPNVIYTEPRKTAVKGAGNTIGVEIEGNCGLTTLLRAIDNGFGVKPDGSLRGLSSEIVSPIMYESDYEEKIRAVLSGAKSSLYTRCGLHIWLGCKDMPWSDLLKIMRYATIWEDSFAELVSPSRRMSDVKNAAGLPIRLSREVLRPIYSREQFIKTLYGDRPLHEYQTREGQDKAHLLRVELSETKDKKKRLKIRKLMLGIKMSSRMRLSKRCNDKGDDDNPWIDTIYDGGCLNRYQWINFHGYFHRRAIEVRLHQGTYDPEKIINWIKLWLCMLRRIPLLSMNQLYTVHPMEIMPTEIAMYYRARSEYYKRLAPTAGPVKPLSPADFLEG